MCYNKHMKRKQGYMSEEIFKKVIDQAVGLGIENVGLYTTGESFLHPKIFEFISYVKDKGIKYVYITTNGIPLDKEKIQKIIDSGLDSIKFSIDAGTEETYEALRVGAKWKKLLENIRMLRKLRDSSGSALRIFASFLITNDNYNDLVQYKMVFKDLIDETLYSFVGNQGGHVDVNSMLPNKLRENMDKIFLPREKWHPCSMLWNRFVVNYDGTLTICCIDFDSELVYGDLNKETLKDAWNNPMIEKFRRIHKEGRFEELTQCYKCDYIKRDESVIRDLTDEIKSPAGKMRQEN